MTRILLLIAIFVVAVFATGCNGACGPTVDPEVGVRFPFTFNAKPRVVPTQYGQVVPAAGVAVQPLYTAPQPVPAAPAYGCAPAPSAQSYAAPQPCR